MQEWTYKRTQDGLEIKAGKMTLLVTSDHYNTDRWAEVKITGDDPALLAKLKERLAEAKFIDLSGGSSGFTTVIPSLERAKAARIAMSYVIPVGDTQEWLAQLRLATGLGREGLPDPENEREKFLELATVLMIVQGRNLAEEGISKREMEAIESRAQAIRTETISKYPLKEGWKRESC